MAKEIILDSKNVAELVTRVEEATRSTEEGVKHFIEPAQGTLGRATSKRHHIVFGRRGSGKSSLLRKAAADLTIDRRPIAYVNLEAFKLHSYPDVLISVLIATFKEFKKWLDTAAIHPSNKISFWNRLFGTAPSRPSFNRSETQKLSAVLDGHIQELEKQLHSAEGAKLKVSSALTTGSEQSAGVSAKIAAGGASVGSEAKAAITSKADEKIEEEFKREKLDFLHRHIMDYQSVFDRIAVLSAGDSYLFLDDLYHIKRSDQPQVIDYFHRMAKDHHLWLKIGTIRHRTDWYYHGDPPIGLKLGDDADQIDLDITLEKYAIAKAFLLRILTNFARDASVTLSEIVTDGAIDRLVLASGGVARDFLSVFRMSIDVARERIEASALRGEKITAEDVNVAAGNYDTFKREEFKRDTFPEDQSLDDEFQSVRDFCLEKAESNCFLLGKDEKGKKVNLIHELVDLKLLHLVRSRVTVSGRKGKIYEAYMLDLSQYAGARKRRGLEIIEFWKADAVESLRKASLIYEVDAAVTT